MFQGLEILLSVDAEKFLIQFCFYLIGNGEWRSGMYLDGKAFVVFLVEIDDPRYGLCVVKARNRCRPK